MPDESPSESSPPDARAPDACGLRASSRASARQDAGFDALLAHRGRVKALARRLVAGADGGADADDVVQETWLAALRSPPRTDGTSDRWLMRVARNAARKVRRAAGRRLVRETAAARARREVAEAADVVVARAEAHRRVVEAVLRLEEPYRATVLLRWFEDVEPEEIARRHGCPVDTVRTRLKRGHALLRARLGGESPASGLADRGRAARHADRCSDRVAGSGADEGYRGALGGASDATSDGVAPGAPQADRTGAARLRALLLPLVAEDLPGAVPIEAARGKGVAGAQRPRVGPATGSVQGGLAAMAIGWKACGVVAVIAVAGFLIWRSDGDAVPAAHDGPAALDAQPSASTARAPRAGRTSVAPPAADGADAEAVSADADVPRRARWLRVVDERGTPLPGASATVLGDESSPGVVEPDGRIRLPADAAPRRALVVVPGRPPLVADVPSGEGQTDIALPGGASVEGVVRIDGVPAREGVVLQFGYADNRNFVGEEAHVAISPHYAAGFEPHRVGVVTGEGGRFRFDGLPREAAGGLRIPDWLAFRGRAVTLRATDVGVPTGALLLDLVAMPRLRGRVVAGGRPAAGALVHIHWTRADGGESSRMRRVDEDGTFVRPVEEFDVRAVKVVVSDPEQRSEREVRVALPLAAVTELGDIEIGTATSLALRVTGRDGRPVVGALVFAAPRGAHKEGTTGPDGVVELAGVGGRASVVVVARGFAPGTATWTTAQGAIPYELVLDAAPVLRATYDPGPASTARGHVKLRIDGPAGLFPEPTSTPGEALPAAGSSPVVGLYHRPEGVTQWYGFTFARREWDVWDLRADTPFRYSVIDDYGTRVAGGEATLAPGEQRDITIRASGVPRTLTVTVTDADGRPVPGAAVRISDAAPTDEAGPQLSYLAAGPEGRAEFPGFRAERAAVRVEHLGFAAWVEPSLVVASDGLALAVRLSPERSLVVCVVDDAGAAVSEADVEVSLPGAPESGAACCDWSADETSGGVHRVAGAPSGALRVAVTHADGRRGRAEIAAGAGEVTVVLRRGD